MIESSFSQDYSYGHGFEPGFPYKPARTQLFNVPFMLHTDGYKIGHIVQYPDGTTRVYTGGTFRNGRDDKDTGVISFGNQAVIQHYLIDYANDTFFSRPEDEVVQEYDDAMFEYFGSRINVDHVRALHRLGYLPLEIRSIPEGRFVPYGVPVMTIENTLPEFFWLTNYVETLLSSALWIATTSATTAFKYRQILETYAHLTGGPVEFAQTFQAHDFSARGHSSPESAYMSGMGHLTCFAGTDTVSAIQAAKHYYSATGLVGMSVPATEHSVMCAGGAMDGLESELGCYRELYRKYPTGILSIVSDTRDFFSVMTEVVHEMHDDTMARDGKTVFRPDSGDPVKILCGDPDAPDGSPEHLGAVRLLAAEFGTTLTDKGYMVLDEHVGLIYGDSITLERCEAICRGLADMGYASCNIVFGVGSFTYQYVTRDTHGFAMKATWAVVNGEEHMLFKRAKTDTDGKKRSAKGRQIVAENADGSLRLIDDLDYSQWKSFLEIDELMPVFLNGHTSNHQTLAEVRANVNAEVAKKIVIPA